jgi:hypothetical protein
MGCTICNFIYGEFVPCPPKKIDQDELSDTENELAYDIYACHPAIIREILRLMLDDPLNRGYLRV